MFIGYLVTIKYINFFNAVSHLKNGVYASFSGLCAKKCYAECLNSKKKQLPSFKKRKCGKKCSVTLVHFSENWNSEKRSTLLRNLTS